MYSFQLMFFVLIWQSWYCILPKDLAVLIKMASYAGCTISEGQGNLAFNDRVHCITLAVHGLF